MSNTSRLLERVRERTGTHTDYAICKVLNVQRTTLNRWKEGSGYPGNEAAFRMASLLGLDAKDVIGLIEEDRADTDAARSFWRSVYPARLRTAIVSSAALAAFLTSPLAAALSQFHPHPDLRDDLYIMRTLRALNRLRERVHGWLTVNRLAARPPVVMAA